MSKVVVGVIAVTVLYIGLARRSGRGAQPVTPPSEGYELGV